MRAIIEVEVPDYQIGQEVSIYFKDTMMIKGIVQESSGDAISEKEQKAYNKGYVDGLQMRDFTKEEAEAYSKALDKMYKPTGLNVNDLIEPCDDAISRQAVLEQTYLWSKDEFLRVTNPFDYLRKRINSLPPATAEQKTGHWIQLDYQRGKFECSKCHTQGYVDTCMYEPSWNYCPNCGARMVEPQESEE